MTTIAVHGARGYLGRELVRLLINHPQVDAIVPISTSSVGDRFADHVPGFRGTNLTFAAAEDSAALDADAVFLAVPGGEAAGMTVAHEQAGVKTVIDLSRDHRTKALAKEDGWVYGFADVWPVAQGASRIANPGCYPTASLLAMAPALQAGLVAGGTIIVDGKSGVSGAGAGLRDDLHFASMNESVRAYKVLHHDHGHEIASAAGILNGAAHPVRFTPHLVPQTRGLLATVYLPAKPGVTAEAIADAYHAAYDNHPNVDFVPEADTSHVRGSNRAQVAIDLDTDTGLMIARGAIDNIQKGGAGTAIQNFNDSFGYPSHTALAHIGGNL